MSIGVIWMAKTAKPLDQLVNASVDIDLKSTLVTISRQERSIAEQKGLMVKNANAKCLNTYLFVSRFSISNSYLFVYFLVGSQDLKCLCKHSCKDHDPNTKMCLK
jgi:hypothetical protein